MVSPNGGGENWGSTSSTILSYTSAIKQRYIGIPYSKKKIWGYQKNLGVPKKLEKNLGVQKKSGVHSYTKYGFTTI